MTPERYAQRRAAGLCVNCPRASLDASRCLTCRQNEAAWRNKRAPAIKQAQTQNRSARHHQRRAAGLCRSCPNSSATYVHCDACRDKQIAYRDQRRAAGLCVRCKRPSPRMACCMACRRRESVASAKRYRAAKVQEYREVA
jgi:hypothetical protein